MVKVPSSPRQPPLRHTRCKFLCSPFFVLCCALRTMVEQLWLEVAKPLLEACDRLARWGRGNRGGGRGQLEVRRLHLISHSLPQTLPHNHRNGEEEKDYGD